MSDPFAQFRKKSATATAALPGTPEERAGYQAFDGQDRLTRVRILRRADQSRSPRYDMLMDICYDDYWGTDCVLIWDFMIVRVVGSNLQEMVKALQLGQAAFIQEFDAQRWDKPGDPKAAIIDSIEVILPAHMQNVGQGAAEGKKGR